MANSKQHRNIIGSLIIFACTVLLILGSIYIGKEVRKWTWQSTATVRYRADIENAFLWGQFSNIVGVRNTYDELLKRHDGDYSHHFKLDYPPLRLLVAATWTSLLQKIAPGIREWRNEYVLTFPMLYLNYLMQLVTGVVLFITVRLWYLRHNGAGDSKERSESKWAALVGLTAAMLFLFNPAVILNSHGWPQWDSWLIAFFAGAVLFSSVNRWGLAGACIGVGCLLKGQILVAAPVLPLAALFQGQWRGALAFLLAWLSTALVLVLPWLLRDLWALPYIFIAATVPTLMVLRLARSGARRLETACMTGMAAFSIAVMSTVFLFETSMTWFHIGFSYGVSRNTSHLVIGPVPNLPELLQHLYNVQVGSRIRLPGGSSLPVTTVLILVYISCLIYSAYRAARFQQSGDANFLIAVFAPWLFMFAFMPYMHERYLVYIAAFSASWVFLGVVPVAVHVLLVVLAASMMLHMMLLSNPGAAPDLLQWFDSVYPQDSSIVVVLALTLVFLVSRHAARQPPGPKDYGGMSVTRSP